MNDETYSLRIITQFLQKHDIPYDYSSANVGLSFVEHGCCLVVNDLYQLSIQTHPDVTSCDFAETALQNMTTRKIVYDGTYGYYDVQRWSTPETLFDHVLTLMKPTQP